MERKGSRGHVLQDMSLSWGELRGWRRFWVWWWGCRRSGLLVGMGAAAISQEGG